MSPRGRLSFPRIKHLKQQCNVSDAHASLSLACPLILPLPLPTAPPPLSQLQSIIFRLSNLYIFLNDALIPNACIICIKSHPHSSPPPSTLPTNNCFFSCLANLKLFVLLLSWRENKVCILDAQLDTNTHTYTFHTHTHTYTHKHTSHTHKHKELIRNTQIRYAIVFNVCLYPAVFGQLTDRWTKQLFSKALVHHS